MFIGLISHRWHVIRIKCPNSGPRCKLYYARSADDRETDLSEILQIEQVFTNVSKGQVAKKEDWEKAFNTAELDKVIEEVGRFWYNGCPPA